MGKEDVVGFLKKAVPWIGAAATGNVPLLVTMAANAVGDALGVEVEATPTAISNAIAGATPEQMMALKAAENDFALKMRELNYKEHTELYATDAADRNSARERETKVGDNTNRIMAFSIVLVWAMLNVLVVTLDMPVGSEQMVTRVLATLDAALMVVLYYYFGSSRGSSLKTEALNGFVKQGKVS